MAGAFRAASQFGDTQATAVASPQNIAIPTTGAGGTVIAGDVAELYVDADGNPTLTTPSGWTLRSGPDDPSASARSWVFTRTLQSGDPGANVSLAGWASTIRLSAVIVVKSGVTETGIQVGVVTQGTATSTYTLPTLTGVPNGAVLTAAFLRRRSGAAGSITVPSPYTAQTNTDPANAYASGANTFQRSGTVVTTGGSVGGEAGSTGTTSIGVNYLVSMPAAATAATATLSGSGTLSAGVTPAVPLSAGFSGSGTLSATVTPAVARSAALSGSGTLSAAVGPAAVALSGTGTLTAAVFGLVAGTLSGSGTLSATTAPGFARAAALSGAGTLVAASAPGFTKAVALSGSGTLVAASSPAFARAAALSGAGTLVATPTARYRYALWTGTVYRPLPPKVWDGAAWRADIPVDIVPATA